MMAEAELRHLHLSEMGIWGKAVRIRFGGGYEDVWLQTIGDRSEAIERGQEAMQRKLLEFRPGGERAAALMEGLKLAPPARPSSSMDATMSSALYRGSEIMFWT